MKKTSRITLPGLILIGSVLLILVRLFALSFIPWPVAFIPLAAYVILVIYRGYEQSRS